MTDNATTLRFKAREKLEHAQTALAVASAQVRSALKSLEAGTALEVQHVQGAVLSANDADERLDAALAMLVQRSQIISGDAKPAVVGKLAATLDMPEPILEAMTLHDGVEVFVVQAWQRTASLDTSVVGADVRLAGQVRRIARVMRLDPVEPGDRIGLVVEPLPVPR